MSAKAPDEAAQGQRSWDRPRSIPEPAALCEIWAIQGSDKGWLENSACLGVKDIGKPCALIAHARFDEGGQARACPLLYPCFYFNQSIKKLQIVGYKKTHPLTNLIL